MRTKTQTMLGGAAAVAAIALAPQACADPGTDAVDRYYFSQLEAQNVNRYQPNSTRYRVTDPVLAIETGHWLCSQVAIDGVASNQPQYALIARSRVMPWGFVWSSPDSTDELIGALGIQIAAQTAYCPQYYAQ